MVFVKRSGNDTAMWIHVLLYGNVHWVNILKKCRKYLHTSMNLNRICTDMQINQLIGWNLRKIICYSQCFGTVFT